MNSAENINASNNPNQTVVLDKIPHAQAAGSAMGSPKKPNIVYPFDFTKIKVVIRRPKQEECETIFLDRKWAKEKIPHFTGVI